MRISRTVQWMREAAQRKQTFVCRALEETAGSPRFERNSLQLKQTRNRYKCTALACACDVSAAALHPIAFVLLDQQVNADRKSVRLVVACPARHFPSSSGEYKVSHDGVCRRHRKRFSVAVVSPLWRVCDHRTLHNISRPTLESVNYRRRPIIASGIANCEANFGWSVGTGSPTCTQSLYPVNPWKRANRFPLFRIHGEVRKEWSVVSPGRA